MSRLALISVAAAVLALAGCAEPQPPEFVSPQYKFKARFGATPREIDQPAGDIPSRLFTAETPSGAYTVRVFELPIPPETASAASSKLLAEGADDLLRSVNATESEKKPITLAGKYPGLALAATTPPPKSGMLRARIYLAGTRLYKVSVFGTEEFANAPAADAFLESFTVTE